tara:strand:+ start:1300 stop:1653 length:354 start_codon:yes stop_codon:yes gene_type:complete
MEQNSFSPRMDTLTIIVPSVNSSPFGGDPCLSTLETGLFLDAQWESICGSNVALAGGQLTGWLLGPASEGTLDLEIDNTHDALRSAFGLRPGNTTTTMYATLAGFFLAFHEWRRKKI